MNEKIPVGSDGFVRFVDIMGNDAAVVQAARVSYGEGTKTVSDDQSLINYLMRHYHTTPFEMVEFKFHVRVPMDIWRQWIRHRTANVNEYSTRYSEAIDSLASTKEDEWRLQSGTNKQGSAGSLMMWPADTNPKTMEQYPSPGAFLSSEEGMFHKLARVIYERRLKFGVAREQARKDLPLSNYTEAYWKIDLHNLFHFLRLRIDSHAQKEIREYAQAIASFVEEKCPMCWNAFRWYRLDAIQLSAFEIDAIKRNTKEGLSKRERAEFDAKCERLGIVITERP